MSNDDNKTPQKDINVNEELAKELLAFKGQYHNHKESMAHAGLVVQIAIFSWIMLNEWPPKWVPPFGSISNKLVAIIGLSLIWVLLILYILWQLRNRKISARQVNDLIKALAVEPPSECSREMRLYKTVMDQMDLSNGEKSGTYLIVLGIVIMSIGIVIRTFC